MLFAALELEGEVLGVEPLVAHQELVDRQGVPHRVVGPLGALHEPHTGLAGGCQQQDRPLAVELLQPVQEDLQHRGLAGPRPPAEDAEPGLVERGERLGLLLPGTLLDLGRQLAAALGAELLLEQRLPAPALLRRRERSSLQLALQAPGDLLLQLGQPLEGHRGRVGVDPEVEGLLVERSLAFDEVAVGTARTPLGEALDDPGQGLGEGEQRVPLFGRRLEHGDRHAPDPALVVLGVDLVGIEEPGRIPLGPHAPVDHFQGDRLRLPASLVHLRKQVGVVEDLLLRRRDPRLLPVVGVGDSPHLLRGQLEPGQEGEQITRAASCKPASGRSPASSPALYRLSSQVWRPSRIACTYSQAFSPFFSSGTKTCRWKAVPPSKPRNCSTLPVPGNGPRFVQTSESTSLSQTRWRSHSPVDLALVLDRLNRLEQPLQGTDRHVVAEVLGDVGEVDHRPVRDTAEDVRGVVTPWRYS